MYHLTRFFHNLLSMPPTIWLISVACNQSNSWRQVIRCISTMCQRTTCRCCSK